MVQWFKNFFLERTPSSNLLKAVDVWKSDAEGFLYKNMHFHSRETIIRTGRLVASHATYKENEMFPTRIWATLLTNMV